MRPLRIEGPLRPVGRGICRPSGRKALHGAGRTGSFFARASPENRDPHFQSALGTGKLSAEEGRPPGRPIRSNSRGDIWFYYYGSRYGEYLAPRQSAKRRGTISFPAALERASPQTATAYFTLASLLPGKRRRSIRRCRITKHAVSTESKARPGAHNHAGRDSLDARQARTKQKPAMERARLAAIVLASENDTAAFPESFWTDAQDTLTSVGKYHVLAGRPRRCRSRAGGT